MAASKEKRRVWTGMGKVLITFHILTVVSIDTSKPEEMEQTDKEVMRTQKYFEEGFFFNLLFCS